MKSWMKLPILALGAALLSAAAAKADTIIATVGPMTGQYAIFGDQMKRGAELAVAAINAKGGLLGQKLKLEIGDDACDPKQAVSVANDLVHRKVIFVAGHFIAQGFAGKGIAVLHDKSAYGKGLADEPKKPLKGKGVTEALYEPYTAGEKAYSALVTRLKNAKIELVYIGGYHTDVGL